MACGQNASVTSPRHGAEGEALLNDATVPTHDEGASLLSESMPARVKTFWSGHKSVANNSGDGSELALEPLRDSHDLDNAHLRAQGHEAALKRTFSPLAALGLGFSVTNSWVGYLSNFGQNLVYGGPQNVVFGLLVATAVQWTITLGLSEVASAFPSAGGQYHFTFILAPTKHKRFAAFVVGWMTLLGWWVITCSGVSLCAVSVAGMIRFWHEAFEAARWQIYLIYLASVVLTAAPLFLAPRTVPRFVQATLCLSVSGFVVIFCMLLGLKKHTQPGSFITRSGLGTSGWSPGTAWVLGVGNALYAYGGTDGAIHIAEEIQRPGKNIPRAMNLTMAIGFSTAFPLFLALMFGVTDIDAVLNSSLPSMQIFYQISQSKGIATFMMCWVVVVYYILYLNITYAVPQGILATRGRKKSLPERPFDLGSVGLVCNILAPLLVTVFGTFICLPPQLPVTTINMNYTPVILVGLFGIILGLWFTRGKKFIGPKIDWELLNLTGCK
ncbi:MAG: hypothetical protein LQ338_005269 [Usnochroma carphineum]|nr:MAG: hypothetical protein LQ338_005269 [Usnochroma carphineum]